MKRHIEAVIFDLGGTLIEYAGPYERWPELETPGLRAAYDCLLNKGLDLPPFDLFRDNAFALLPGRWQAATDGRRNLRLMDYLQDLLAEMQIDSLPPSVLNGAAQTYQAAVCSQAVLIDHAPQTLQLLKEQGYKLGLLSNTMFEGTAHLADLRRYALDKYFDATLFSADVNKWKPNAAPYLHLLEDLGVAPRHAVFVGDSPHHDIVGGKNAGLYTIHFHSSDRFGPPQQVLPEATVTALAEIPALLALWAAGG